MACYSHTVVHAQGDCLSPSCSRFSVVSHLVCSHLCHDPRRGQDRGTDVSTRECTHMGTAPTKHEACTHLLSKSAQFYRADIDNSRRLQHERELSELRIASQSAKMTEGPTSHAVQGAGATREHTGNGKYLRADDARANENSHEDVVSLSCISESPSEKGRLQEQLRMLEWSPFYHQVLCLL